MSLRVFVSFASLFLFAGLATAGISAPSCSVVLNWVCCRCILWQLSDILELFSRPTVLAKIRAQSQRTCFQLVMAAVSYIHCYLLRPQALLSHVFRSVHHRCVSLGRLLYGA